MSDGRTPDEYAELLDGVPDSIFVLDAEGDVRFVNQRVVDGVDGPRDDVHGNHYTEFSYLLEDDAAVEAFVEAVEAVLEDGETDETRLEVAIDTADEGRLEVEARIVPHRDGAMVVMRDVTDRVETRAHLETLTDQLALVNRLLRHDIRNQLAVIKGWATELDADATAAGTDGDGEEREVTDRLLTAVEKAVRLTEEAREVTTALADSGDLQTRPVRLDTIVKRAVEGAANEYPDADVVGPDDCPGVAVEANELLESVFRNLLMNAVAHNDRETPRVEVTGRLEVDTVEVSVADNGPGIPDAEKERIFDRDHRGASSSGTGLGLFLVDFLVDAYGGTVTVADNEPRGTVFTVRLPIADAD